MLYLHIAVACILVFSQLISRLFARYHQPPVLGMLLLGLFLGPSCLGLLEMNVTLRWLAEAGVMLLLFMAGLESNIRLMRRHGKVSVFCAVGGIVVPFLFGFILSLLFGQTFIHALFMGAILTATSVSVSIMTLFGLGRLKSTEGQVILNAAIIDDIFAVIILGVIVGLGGSGASCGLALLKIAVFFVVVSVMGIFAFRPLVYYCERSRISYMTLAVTLGIVFFFAWCARIAGVAPVTGAYLAGLFLGRTSPRVKKKMLDSMDIIGHGFFIPFFFVGVGLEVVLGSVHGGYLFLIFFILAAVVSKFLGVSVAGRIAALDWGKSFRIGAGMIPRGEVALAIASIGAANKLITQGQFSSTVIMVIITMLITPILLELLFKRTGKETGNVSMPDANLSGGGRQ